MTDLVNITVDSLVNDENFKNKLLTHMENIMKDGKITANDLPDLVLFVVDCYNNISRNKLSMKDIPEFIRRIINHILNENNIIPENKKDEFLDLVEVGIKLVLIKPKVKKFCLEKFCCCKN